ncbi:DNA polymerase-3 subunit delta' [Methylomagnum ishizawai]|uniref:DNA polymerase III subunit delta' n=1 Tax=Methylomagnum ishizawai TaxID=1760988 RepID=A0A1Y6D2W5_9GAMM|nr:DNA polymerase III subunit delta' [Methylomagnum ishizawai]SMF94902.1 DNA polymerase-3 subunit delta' [Methylomagnum ishizawai]
MPTEIELYPWLAGAWHILGAHLAAGRVPQALLILGAAGIGKTHLAGWFAQRLLCTAPGEFGCGQCPACRLFLAGTHPDFLKVQPAEPGKGIGVDAIRHLTADLALKSQFEGYRVVVIAPAQAMNISAANALLKTLEEPAERTVMLLLSEAQAGLPATILSRCQRLPVALPDAATACRWLETRHPGCGAATLLAAAQGSPLRALALAGTEVAERRRTVFRQWGGVLLGQEEPVAVAELWEKQAHEEFVEWISTWTMDLIRLLSVPADPPRYNPDLAKGMRTLAGRLNLRDLFEYWNLVLRSKRALGGQANRQLLLEELLIHGSRLGRSANPPRLG